MRAVIKATGISIDPSINSSIDHAAIAAKNCIEAAGIDMQEINFMFNVGIYRDQNMVEPSMAALIQKKIGINPDFIRFPVSSPAFSTDLMNGAIGALNAFQMADSLFKAGRKGYVLVVASDIHPSMAPADGFAVNPCGSAVLLEASESDLGFSDFAFDNTSGDYIGEASYIDFSQHGIEGRNSMAVSAESDYQEKLLAFTTDTARKFILQHQIDINKTLVIGPSFSSEFASELARNLDCPEAGLVNVAKDYGNIYTATFGVGINFIEKNKEQLKDYTQILFVGGSANLNAGCALYKL